MTKISLFSDSLEKDLEQLAQDPTPVSTETLTVTMFLNIVSDFSNALMNDLERRNRKLLEQSGLTIHMIFCYLAGLIIYRVADVSGDRKLSNQLLGNMPRHIMKQLYYPVWIEHVVSMIGRCFDKERGLILVPQLEVTPEEKSLFYDLVGIEVSDDFSINYVDMVKVFNQVSNTLELFSEHGLAIVDRVLPKTNDGDLEVMSMIVVDGVVKSYIKGHPAKSYIASFMQSTLKDLINWKAMYRFQYDDIELINAMITSSSIFFGGAADE